MIEANRWKLGLFIIMGVTLVFAGIVYFGVSQLFVPTINLMTIFEESVDGLSVGSPVKYNGVPIGTVSKIMIEEGDMVSVYMKLYPAVMDTKAKAKAKAKLKSNSERRNYIRKTVDSYVKKGFRCSLQLSGISGNKYIGFKQHNDINDYAFTNNPEIKRIIGSSLFVPSVPTYISGAPDNVSKILNQISKVNFTEIGSSINENLSLMQTLMIKMETLLTTLESQEVQRILLQTTSKVDETLDAATELCNQISTQPNSVIRGNESSAIFPPEK